MILRIRMRPRARMMEARRRRPHSQRIHFIMNHHRARARARARYTLGGRADRNLRVQVREYHSHTPSTSPPARLHPRAWFRRLRTGAPGYRNIVCVCVLWSGGACILREDTAKLLNFTLASALEVSERAQRM